MPGIVGIWCEVLVFGNSAQARSASRFEAVAPKVNQVSHSSGTIPSHSVQHVLTSFRLMSSELVSSRLIPSHIVSYHTILYHTMLYHSMPYHTIPCHTIPYHTIPYHTIPYHTMPYRTIPYHTIPSDRSNNGYLRSRRARLACR